MSENTRSARPFAFRSLPRSWALAAAAAFAVLALLAAFAEPVLLLIDRPVAESVVAARSPIGNEVMALISLMGTRYVIGVLVLSMLGWSLITRRCRVAALILVAAFLLNPAVEFFLKEIAIGRVRPNILPLVPGRGASFPSGHVLASAGFYGAVAVAVWDAARSSLIRFLTVGASAALVLAIAASRVYLGVHWTSDVVAGMLLGSLIVLATRVVLGEHRLSPVPLCCDRRRSVVSTA